MPGTGEKTAAAARQVARMVVEERCAALMNGFPNAINGEPRCGSSAKPGCALLPFGRIFRDLRIAGGKERDAIEIGIGHGCVPEISPAFAAVQWLPCRECLCMARS